MNFPVELAPQPSRLMMAGLLVGHSVLGLGFLRSSLPGWLVALAGLGLASSAVVVYRRWRRMAGLRFVLGGEGTLQVIPPSGAAFEARTGQACRDLGWAVWLAWRPMGDVRDEPAARGGILMLPRDALSPEAWRALRIWLRFRSGLTAPEAAP